MGVMITTGVYVEMRFLPCAAAVRLCVVYMCAHATLGGGHSLVTQDSAAQVLCVFVC